MSIRIARLLIDSTVASLENLNEQIEHSPASQKDEFLAQLETLEFDFNDTDMTMEAVDWEGIAKVIFFGALLITAVATLVAVFASLGRSSGTSVSISKMANDLKRDLDRRKAAIAEEMLRKEVVNARVRQLLRAVYEMSLYGAYVLWQHPKGIGSSWETAMRRAGTYTDSNTSTQVSIALQYLTSVPMMMSSVGKAAPRGLLKKALDEGLTGLTNLSKDLVTLITMKDTSNQIVEEFLRHKALTKKRPGDRDYIPSLGEIVNKLQPQHIFNPISGLGFSSMDAVGPREIMNAVRSEMRLSRAMMTAVGTIERDLKDNHLGLLEFDHYIPTDKDIGKKMEEYATVIKSIDSNMKAIEKMSDRAFSITAKSLIKKHAEGVQREVKAATDKVKLIAHLANSLVVARGTLIRELLPAMHYYRKLCASARQLSDEMSRLSPEEVDRKMDEIDNEFRKSPQGQPTYFSYRHDEEAAASYAAARNAGSRLVEDPSDTLRRNIGADMW